MHADKYLSKVRKGMTATDIFVVEAVQLQESQIPGDGNAVEIAAWTAGEANWAYDPKEGLSKASVSFVAKDAVHDKFEYVTLKEKSWVYSRDEGATFGIMSDDSFREAFDFHAANARYVCYYCLADMRNTQVSDSEKKCPNCSSGYNGPPRTAEYNILKAAGMVLMEEVE